MFSHYKTFLLSIKKYSGFVLLLRRICRAAAQGTGTKYAVEFSLITVAIAGVGFITEASLAVEYIQGTRLALIRADILIATLFIVLSFMKLFILWVKWLFWLRRWKEVLRVYIHNLELNIVPNQIVLYNSLSIIMAIILHDVLQKTRDSADDSVHMIWSI